MGAVTGKIVGAVSGAIALIIVIVCLFAMSPTIVEQEETATSDASNWNFTGAAGAESLIGLSPFVWFAAILLVIVGGAFALTKSMGVI